MTMIRFENGSTVTIRDVFVQAAKPELTAILNLLGPTSPGYGSIPFGIDEDFDIARAREKVGDRWGVLRTMLNLRPGSRRAILDFVASSDNGSDFWGPGQTHS